MREELYEQMAQAVIDGEMGDAAALAQQGGGYRNSIAHRFTVRIRAGTDPEGPRSTMPEGV